MKTTSAIAAHEVGISICKMLGVDPGKVKSISLSIDATSTAPLSVEVVMCPDGDFDIEDALKSFKFVAIEEDTDIPQEVVA